MERRQDLAASLDPSINFYKTAKKRPIEHCYLLEVPAIVTNATDLSTDPNYLHDIHEAASSVKFRKIWGSVPQAACYMAHYRKPYFEAFNFNHSFR